MHTIGTLSRHRPNGFGHRRPENTRTTDDAPQVAHTLAACTRCRMRKTRCDPRLPRCTPCERSGNTCEYFDASKNKTISRSYVVRLEEKIQQLNAELSQLNGEEPADGDPETMVRAAAAVRFKETDESKYLGPSSGIAITRLVMQLAKQCTSTNSIKDVISEAKARQVKDRFRREESKPTSKVYPLISSFAADKLPNRDLAEVLIRLFLAKVQYMYPLLHEPTFVKDVEAVYAGSRDPYQNFIVNMVIAISLQKLDTQHAGLADSYYLAALEYLEPAVKLKNMKTLQCYALIAEYSNLTPTRTAVYFIIGLAVRLCQDLGFTEEKSIVRGEHGQIADPLEIDMRRRLFWIILTMDYGLAHGLGRPSICATRPEHFDVAWFEEVDDKYITTNGILPGPYSTKKWIAKHFFKMRMLGLDIITALYLKKRAEPQDNNHPWFQQMEDKLYEWQDASPNNDEGSGFGAVWFRGRMNTMIILMYRPSPQVPRPSAKAALKCYDACAYNIPMQQAQSESRSVDLTWAFTLTLFSNINTILWSLSYSEVRQSHPREEVERYLNMCLGVIERASERWPGVESALELYFILIGACMKVYDKDGDIPISASTPSDKSSPMSLTEPMAHSRSQSESDVSSVPVGPRPEKLASFGDVLWSERNGTHTSPATSMSYPSSVAGPPRSSFESIFDTQFAYNLTMPFDPRSQYPLPTSFPDLVNWNPAYTTSSLVPGVSSGIDVAPDQGGAPGPMDEQYLGFLSQASMIPQAQALDRLNFAQQLELMQNLETDGMPGIEMMIADSEAIFGPVTYPNYET